MSPDLVEYFGVSATTVSWQVTLAGLVIGIGAVVYSSLSDSISIRNLLVLGIVLICVGSLLGYITHTNYWLIVVSRIIQSAGFSYSAFLIDKKDLQFGFLSFVTDDPIALNYSSIIIIIVAIALLAIILFWLLVGRKLDINTNTSKRAA
ncbi:MFS transporter [Peribacillus sp. JNUCC 23]